MSPPAAPDHAAVMAKLEVIEEALLGNARPGSAPGLLRRMEASEVDRADLRRILLELQAAVRALEATPGKTALSWVDRIALAVITMGLAGAGSILGHQIGGKP